MRNHAPAVGFAAIVCAALSPAVFGQTVTLNASDAVNTTSFNAAGHWSNGLAPSAGNNYVVPNGTTLRTPFTAPNDYTFAGSSLTIGGGTSVATMAFKSPGSGTITINNLTLNDGAFSNAVGATFTLAGNGVTMLSGGGIIDADATARVVSVAEALTGVGGLTINNSGGSGQGIINLLDPDSYSGGTIVNNFTLLDVQSDGGLGTGSVTVNNGGALTLTGGTTNEYIASTANLILGNTGTVNLSYNGTDNITSLSLNGGSTFFTSGTYGSLTSTAQNKSSLFTGNGILLLGGAAATPEPSAVALLCFASLSAGMLVLRRRPVAARVIARR